MERACIRGGGGLRIVATPAAGCPSVRGRRGAPAGRRRRQALSDAADGEPRLNSKLVFDMIMDGAALMRHVVGCQRLKSLFLNYELAYLGRQMRVCC